MSILKRKVIGKIPTGGESVTVDDQLSDTSVNSVQNKVVKQAIDQKQDTLVSGQNIKTINRQSLLGEGNIQIEGGGEQVQSDWNQANTQAKDYIKNKPTIPDVSGKADLVNGKVPSEQLPSYVDDVINGYYYNGSFYKEAAHTTVITGEEGKIYVDILTDESYRWSGSAYILISNPYSADEEDLTVVNNNIKFKDRPNTDGMGRIILRKNMVSGVNTLTQAMMQTTNTIYVIQYDFTLGEDIIIPANCVLEFNGGSISGDGVSLTYNKTNIIGEYDGKIKCLCSGSVFNQMATPEMYGAAGDYETDDYNALQACIDNNINIYLPKQYSISKTLWVKNIGTHITGNGKRITTIKKTTKTPTENVDAIFLVKGSPSRISNIEISGMSLSTTVDVDYCIKFENTTTYSSLYSLRIEGFGTGVSITDGWVFKLSDVDVYVAQSSHGVIVTNVNVIDMFHCFGSGCGVFFNKVTGTLVGCDFENSNACYDISNGSTVTLMHCRTETYYVSIRSNSSEVTCIGGIYETHYSNAAPLGFIEAIDSSVKIYGTKFYFDNYGGYPASASGAIMFKLQGSTMYYDRDIDTVRDADWQNMTLLSVDATSVLNSVGNVKTKNVSRYGVTGDIDYSGRTNMADDYVIVAQFPLGYRRSVECKCNGLGRYFDDIINIDAIITAFFYNGQPNITVDDKSTSILNSSQERTFSVTAEYANGILTVKFNITPGKSMQFDYRAKVDYTYQYFEQNMNNPYLE